jgi:hypothetical protein
LEIAYKYNLSYFVNKVVWLYLLKGRTKKKIEKKKCKKEIVKRKDEFKFKFKSNKGSERDSV